VETILYLFLIASYFPLALFWIIILTKKLLFWSWLWQLKEYQVLRFIDHFRTYKGKKIIFNFFNLAKLITLIGLIVAFPIFIFFLLVVFLAEAGLTIFYLLKRKILRPVLTKKTTLILLTGIFLEFFLFFFVRNKFGFEKGLNEQFFLSLLVIDLLAPLIFSLLVLSFQPLTILLRNGIIKKAKQKREKFKNLTVIGITGSYGKSSTKEFLALILSEKFKVLKTKENQNSEVGISRCILDELKPEHELFICEMGAYMKGGIKLLSDIAQPKIGILTGINEQHLATFGSQNNIVQAKFELVESLPGNGLAILNMSDPKVKSEKPVPSEVEGLKVKSYPSSEVEVLLLRRTGNSKLKIIRCSIKEQIKELEVKRNSISFKIEDVHFNVNLVGKQNVENLLMAIVCAKELGMSLEEISGACQKIKSFRKTMELKQGRGGVTVIDDTYSANPKGVIAALNYLKDYPFDNKEVFAGPAASLKGGPGDKAPIRIIIMPCLIELGSASKEIHYEIGKRIGEVCDLAIITTQDRFKEIRKGVLEGKVKSENILFLEDSRRIFEKIKPFLKEGNVILLESRVPEKLINFLLKEK